jgi:hypothetical protein
LACYALCCSSRRWPARPTSAGSASALYWQEIQPRPGSYDWRAYDSLLAVTYQTIKRTDPTATVLLGGLAFIDQPGHPADEFLAAILADPDHPALASFDVVALHFYHARVRSPGCRATPAPGLHRPQLLAGLAPEPQRR